LALSSSDLPTYHYSVALVAYLSHPIGPAMDMAELSIRSDNIDTAGHWFKTLVECTRWAILCPWLAYTVTLGNELYGPRALTDQIRLLDRCDLLVQVGNYRSGHMDIEENHARRRNMPVLNLVGLHPADDDDVKAEVAKRAAAITKTARVRMWLPPLDDHDIDVLRAAEIMLAADPFSEEARALIQQIMSAALKR
jgi:hypothetical protein